MLYHSEAPVPAQAEVLGRFVISRLGVPAASPPARVSPAPAPRRKTPSVAVALSGSASAYRCPSASGQLTDQREFIKLDGGPLRTPAWRTTRQITVTQRNRKGQQG